MKFLLHILFLFYAVIESNSQVDSSLNDIKPPCFHEANEKIKMKYNIESQTYDYSGNWDFDGDGETDSIAFIGNKGVHVFYHLKIVLSANKNKQEYSFLELDFPCLGNIKDLKKAGFYPPPVFTKFVVFDFDSDGHDEIFINIDIHQSPIPEKWRKNGVTSRYILIDCEKGRVLIKNFF